MMRFVSCVASLLMAGVLSMAATASAHAADAAWPRKPIRLIVPYPPGGSADTLGRALAQSLTGSLNQTVVVENRAGAAGFIGSQAVARAEPDGYTLVVSGIGSHVIAPLQNPNAFDPIKDFTHIAFLGGPPAALIVNADSPVKDLAGFITYARSLPNGVSWGSPGQGTHGSLIGDAFKDASRLKMVHVAYKGANAAVTDLIANQIQAAFITLSSATAGIKSGRIRAIALTADKRLDDFPDVPTFTEQGYPKLTGTTWFSLSGPAGMDPVVTARLNAAVRQAMRTPEIQRELRQQNMVTEDWDAATFTRYVGAEITHWSPYLQAAEVVGGNTP
ncbi:tripartite tricarboxylate transporter substrate binding protein [Pigmentiphaga litoralis]|uniref:tripartite tricarboxylate transporter substrate binding protein n=1 Tax=Pigmentiphaga litoralis TaxID=516702 RepID=UPI003B436CC6